MTEPPNSTPTGSGATAGSPLGAGPVPVWLIAVGDELLEGRTVDTNSHFIQQNLGVHEVSVQSVTAVRDEPEAIAEALAAAKPGGLVFLTGGLGGTPDDLTRDAVAHWAGVGLQEDAVVLESLEARFRRRGLALPDMVRRQAQVPCGLSALANTVGTAPALVGELAGRAVVLLPGVPSELRGLLPGALSWLQHRGMLPAPRPHLLLRTAQLAETTLVELCRPLQRRHGSLTWSWWLARWGVDLRVAAPASVPGGTAAITALREELVEALAPWTYATEMKELNAVVQELMIARGAALSVAESCTAGLLGARLTEHAGSSAFFRGGVLAYADAVKEREFGIPAELLARHGAVSSEVAAAMATGCRQRFGTDYALAVTGVAGPGGGSETKPVGTTWLAAATAERVWTRCYRFPGRRDRNRQLAVSAALDTLRRLLLKGPDASPFTEQETWGALR